MANEAAKKRVIANAAMMKKYLYIILGMNAAYVSFRVVLLWDSFSGWHMGGFSLLLTAYAILYGFILRRAAAPKYREDGVLLDGGADLDGKGVMEYTWDLLWTTMFVQLMTGFVSDWFWLVALIPPCIGTYYLWTMVIYPWISRPDPEQPMPDAGKQKGQRVKYGKAR